MEERASGIILRTRPFTETSLVVQWLTLEFGRIATVAKGARRAKSPFLGKLDLFYEAEFSFQRSARSELHNLREIVVRNFHATLREDLGWLQQATYCSCLIERFTEIETPIAELHALVRCVLDSLPAEKPDPGTILFFEFALLSLLGYRPKIHELPTGLRNLREAIRISELTDLKRTILALDRDEKRTLNAVFKRIIMDALGSVPEMRLKALKAGAQNH